MQWSTLAAGNTTQYLKANNFISGGPYDKHPDYMDNTITFCTDIYALHFVHNQKYINSSYCEFIVTDKDETPPTHILQIEKCCLLFWKFYWILDNCY